MVGAYREGMIDESKIAERYEGLGPELNERQRRLWAASEARSHGRGGIIAVSRATGSARTLCSVGSWSCATGLGWRRGGFVALARAVRG